MEFYLKLMHEADDNKLNGITLFEDFGKQYYKDCGAVLQLGQGKAEYYVSSHEEFYLDYANEIEDVFNTIAKLVPDARICYVSLQDEGSGESDTMLKMENDDHIYHCSTLWFDETDYDIGTDEWCDRVIQQTQDEMDELSEYLQEIEYSPKPKKRVKNYFE